MQFEFLVMEKVTNKSVFKIGGGRQMPERLADCCSDLQKVRSSKVSVYRRIQPDRPGRNSPATDP